MKSLLFAAVACVTFANAQSVPGFRGDFLKQLEDVEKKCVSLAEATPEAKYVWRPAEGVRSIGEVFVHIAGANYMFTRFIGAKLPEGLKPDMEKTMTKKADIEEFLKKSFAHAREAVTAMPDADLEKQVKMFGNMVSERQALFIMANHMHEHLGQSIAYARTNGVIPPWSQK